MAALLLPRIRNGTVTSQSVPVCAADSGKDCGRRTRLLYRTTIRSAATAAAIWATFNACAVAQTPGCGNARHPGTAGRTVRYNRTFEGMVLTHTLTLPQSYNTSVPSAMLLFFHGWGADATSCGALCDKDAPEAGFITLSMQGIGTTNGNSVPSWNGSGSVASPGSRGATCEVNATNNCYDDCGSLCTDNCWWTTCLDSVGEVVDALDALEAELCIDTAMIWATGCSNGGIFTYQLAVDSRTAPRLAGIAPVVGLPHIGFLGAPAANTRISYISSLGAFDTTVPPFSNTNESDRSLDTRSQPGGWYYQTGYSTSESIAKVKKCTGPRERTADWDISAFPELNCTRVPGCAAGDVVECVGPFGHTCDLPSQNAPLLAFARAHPLTRSAT